jgi:hypothetical protein
VEMGFRELYMHCTNLAMHSVCLSSASRKDSCACEKSKV